MPRWSFRSPRRIRKRRNGFSVRALVIGLVILGGFGTLVYYTFPSLSLSSQDSGPMLHTVAVGSFFHDITERGSVESASNVDIRCEVESRGSQGTMILEIIPEGTYVKPGDMLCKLDSSALEQEMVQQQIICNTSEAQVIQAQNDYETAKIALEEYTQGTFTERKLEIQAKEFVAEESLRNSEQMLKYTKKLFARGYVTELTVEEHEFAVEKAKKDLEQAETELHVLETYTRLKNVKQLEADIKTKKARWDSEEHSNTLDQEKLAELETQVEKCTVLAPDYGQIVYANVSDRRGNSEIIIEEGGSVRERQVIFRLPDPKRMQVKAKINESSVAMVKEGMLATVRLDAFPELELTGQVEKVNEYPVPTSFFSGNVKEYETIIRIDLPGQTGDPAEKEDYQGGLTVDSEEEPQDESADDATEESDEAEPKVELRPGMTAEVKIRVETQSSVVHVPVQTIVAHGGKNYCLTYDKDNGWAKREVKIGSTNDKTVVIAKGLEAGDVIVMGAMSYRDKIDWPEIKVDEKTDQAGSQQPAKPEPGGAQGAAPNPVAMFKGLDTNQDGKLTVDEAPPLLKSNFADADKNSDGAVDQQEFTAALAAAGRGRPGGERGPGGGGPGRGPRGGGPGAGRGAGGRPGSGGSQ